MKIKYQIILFVVLFQSCKPEYRPCISDSPNELLNLYSDVLNELVVRHFYNFYLGKDEEAIFNAWAEEKPDTVGIRNKTIRLHNKLYNDSMRFCTILLDTSFQKRFNPWHYIKDDSNPFEQKIKKIILKYTRNGQSLVDSLNNAQLQFQPKDFHLCTAKMISLRDAPDTLQCFIGVIQLSKVFWNRQKTRGILYCSFRCGGLCGKGLLLEISKDENRWKIKGGEIMWIS